MTGTEPTEAVELSGRVLEIIGAYRVGGALDRRNLYPKTPPAVMPESAVVIVEGYVRDGVYHLPDPGRRAGDAARPGSPEHRVAAA